MMSRVISQPTGSYEGLGCWHALLWQNFYLFGFINLFLYGFFLNISFKKAFTIARVVRIPSIFKVIRISTLFSSNNFKENCIIFLIKVLHIFIRFILRHSIFLVLF